MSEPNKPSQTAVAERQAVRVVETELENGLQLAIQTEDAKGPSFQIALKNRPQADLLAKFVEQMPSAYEIAQNNLS